MMARFRYLRDNTVVATIVLSLLWVAAAVAFASKVYIGWAATLLWLALVLATFHGLFWTWRRCTTQNQLKGLEYIYILFGLVGALGFVEVQSSLLEVKASQIIAHSTMPASQSGWCAAKTRAEMSNQSPTTETLIRCDIETELNQMFVKYDPERMDRFLRHLEGVRNFRGRDRPEYLKAAFDDPNSEITYMEAMRDRLRKEVYSHEINTKSMPWLFVRLTGFYVLLIGVSIKVAKTTAEIQGWFVSPP
jgi:hypothetical protein